MKAGAAEPRLALKLSGVPRSSCRRAAVTELFGRIGPIRRCLVQPKTGEAYIEYILTRDAEQALKLVHQRQLAAVAVAAASEPASNLSDSVSELVRATFQAALVPAQRGKNPLQRTTERSEPVRRPVEGALPLRTVRVRRRDAAAWSVAQETRFRSILERFGTQVWTGASTNGLSTATGALAPTYTQERERELILPTWVDARNVCGMLHDLVLEHEPSTDQREGLSAQIVGISTRKQCRVILRNLPFRFSLDALLERLRQVGPLVAVNVPRKAAPTGGASSDTCWAGYAFAEYFTRADANAAVQRLNGQSFCGRVLALDRALSRDDYRERQASTADNASDASRDSNANTEGDGRASSSEACTTKAVHASHEADTPASALPAETAAQTPVADGAHAPSDRSRKRQRPATTTTTTTRIERLEASSSDSMQPEADQAKPPHTSSGRDGEASRVGAGTSEDRARAMLACTLFVRHVPLDATAAQVKALLEPYGPIRYCALVRDSITGLPRGRAFVCFAERASAERVLNEASSDAPASLHESAFQLHGQRLQFSWALSRTDVAQVVTQRQQSMLTRAHHSDRRNLYLALEGVIERHQPAAAGLSESELALRERLEQAKQRKLRRNPHTFVSRTLLSVHNIPRSLRIAQIKAIFAQAGASTETDAKPAVIKQVRIARERSRKQRVCAYAFVEFATHDAALRALRLVNNNPNVLPAPYQGRRLIVQFAIEDERKLRILAAARAQKQHSHSAPNAVSSTTRESCSRRTSPGHVC
jgi:RNA recognition motif-containing protein